MKKRLIAALVLLTLVIGLCTLGVTATKSTDEYMVGYAKVDLNPYYTQEARDYLEGILGKQVVDQVEVYWKAELGVDIVYGETIMPVSLQGNNHTEYRLAIGKQDDNGDGIVDKNDGIFATCIAVTDCWGETVFLMSTDMINGSESITSQVRKMVYDKYKITGDRVMIDGSHSHHAPSFSADSNVKGDTACSKTGVPFPKDVHFRTAAYYMHQYWIKEVLPQKLFEAAQKSYIDRKAATMSKGTIEAEEALCAKENIMVGDTLNAIRQENGKGEIVPVLHGSLPDYVKDEDTEKNNNGEQYWDEDGVMHVVVPELADGLYYNNVRHDQSTTVEAVRNTVWQDAYPYYACTYPKAGSADYPNLQQDYPYTPSVWYIPSNWIIKDGRKADEFTNEQITANGIYDIPKTYATGNNFNGGLSAVSGVGSASTPTIYILKEPDGKGYVGKGQGPLPRDYIDTYRLNTTDVEVPDNSFPRLKNDVTVNGKTYQAGTRVYRFIDAVIAYDDHATTEVDDTLLVLKFDIIDEKYQDILLVNWRAHTNKNRKSSVDYKKEYTEVGFYDSFFQISSDWINALRYALEQEEYRVAYFSGASGNVNCSSNFGGWYEAWWTDDTHTEERKPTYVTEDDVNNEDLMADGKTYYKYKKADIGKCKESLLGYSVYDAVTNQPYVIKDASHIRNNGPIYGTELAEVALELLNAEESAPYHMTQVSTPSEKTQGVRSLQTIYQTKGKTTSVEEFLAAGQHHYEDVKDDNIDDLGSTITFTVFWWTDKNGQPIVDKAGGCSMLNRDGSLAQKCVQGVPQVDKNNNKVFYKVSDVQKLYDIDFDKNKKAIPEGEARLQPDTKYTIASQYHAGDALRSYGTATAGPAVELNAIMLCDKIALITATGELFDRYSDKAEWDTVGNQGIIWTTDDKKPDNKWESLHNKDTYGEPFFLGYCNDSNGYMPSRITYDLSTGVDGKSQGSYETQTTSYKRGTGEEVMDEFAWMLKNIDSIDSKTDDLQTEEFYCEHCKGNKQWLPLSRVLAAQTDENGQHHNIPKDGHYYVDSDANPMPAFTARYVCLELNGKELKGPDRALSIGTGGVVSIQDSSENKAGAVVGRGFVGGNANGGAIVVPGGSTLNLYSGTLKLAVEEGRALPENGGVLCVSGTYNMYGGTIEGGQCHNAGGTIYSYDNTNLNLYGGSIQNGEDYVGRESILTACSRIRGNVLLAGDASVAELTIWPEDDALRYSQVTVQGKYTGYAKITFKNVNATDLPAGKVIGLCDKADLSDAALIVSNTSLVPVVAENRTDLVLGEPETHACEYCGEQKAWLPLFKYLEFNDALAAGHYYVDANDREIATQTISEATVCLDLNGMTLKGTENAFVVNTGGILNIQDSQGNGTLTGQGFMAPGSNNKYGASGGTVRVYGGTLNLYSGKLNATVLDGRYKPGNGAVVSVTGTFNMYGGEIIGGDSGNIGGAVCVERGANNLFNMSGGKISGGKAATYNNYTKCVIVRNKITLSGDAKIETLGFWPNGDIGPLETALEVKGAFTGKVDNLVFNVDSVEAGLDIGTSDEAVIPKEAFTVAGQDLYVAAEGENLVLKKDLAALVTLGVGETKCATVDEAAAQCQSPGTKGNLFKISHTVKLLADAETLSFDKPIVLDLNGYNVDKVIANGEGTIVYCMDSANTSVVDGTTVYDEDACGVVGETAGDGDVQGLPACVYEKDGKDKLVPSYLPLEEKNGGWSFHAVNLNVTKGFVRPSWRGMYFLAEFGGDDRIVDLVATFGVAMSVKGVPDAESMWDTSIPTEMTNGSPYRFGDAKLTNVQNILSNVMKPGLSIIDNYTRSRTKLYVRAYLKTKDGKYIFGNVAETSLKTLTEKISDQKIGPDGDISGLNGDQWKALKQMYTDYQTVMDKWNIPNLKKAINENP